MLLHSGLAFYFEWEVRLMRFLQSYMGGFGISLATLATFLGEVVVGVGIMGFIYWCWDKDMGRFVAMNILMALAIDNLIKDIFTRLRPYFVHEEIKCLRPVKAVADIYDIRAQGYSFPSAHSATAVSLYSSIGIYTKKKWLIVLGIVLPLLVGLSRVCLGVHYPTDVLFGWLTGLLAILIVPWLFKKIGNRIFVYAIMIGVTIPGWFFAEGVDYYTSFGSMLGFILGNEFEIQFVDFENTRKPRACVLRLLGGVIIYLVLSFLLKLPFDKNYLDSVCFGSHLIRAARYTITLFVSIGLYPLLFRKIKFLH